MGNKDESNVNKPLQVARRVHTVEPVSHYAQIPLPEDKNFIGRERELAVIDQSFQDPTCRLLTLVGLGGIGKTRLAWEAGTHIAHYFAHGSYFIPLAAIASSAQLVPTLASSLGYSFHGSEPPQTQLINFLQHRKLLLVLDNFEHLMDGVGLIIELMQAVPGMHLLITSRERLNIREEWVLDVSGLDYPRDDSISAPEAYSAVQFFLQSARRVKADFALTKTNQAQVIRICRLVEGMPLGIELAASWLRVLSCSNIGDEIERNVDFLSSNLRNMPEKHRSMRAVFDHSFHLLTAQQQQSFRRLAIFRGGFTRDAAEAVAGASMPVLAGLADRCLIRVDATGRYDIHERLRQYAADQLERAGETGAIRESHSAYFAAWLQEKWSGLRNEQQITTLAIIEADFENVRLAWQTMVEQRNATALSASVYTLWRYCDLRSHILQALALLEQAEHALKLAVRSTDAELARGRVLTRYGIFHQAIGEPAVGLPLIQAGLDILRGVGTPEDIGLALDAMALLYAWLGEFILSIECCENAVQIAREHKLDWLLARASLMMIYPLTYLNQLEKAVSVGVEGLEMAERCGDGALIASINRLIGGAVAQAKNYAEAKLWFERGLQGQQQVGQRWLIVRGHYEVGYVSAYLHEYAYSASHFRQSFQLLAEMNNHTWLIFEALRYVAPLFALWGNKARAIMLLDLVIQHPNSFKWQRDWAQNLLNEWHIEAASRSSGMVGKVGNKELLYNTIHELISALSEVGNPPATESDPVANSMLADPLTTRELEILRWVAEGLSNHEIADQLILAPSTVKWYISEILSKLHATSRTQAVTRARELKLPN